MEKLAGSQDAPLVSLREMQEILASLDAGARAAMAMSDAYMEGELNTDFMDGAFFAGSATGLFNACSVIQEKLGLRAPMQADWATSQ